MNGAVEVGAELAPDRRDSGTAAGVVLAGRYRVLPERRVEALDAPRAKAYAAVDETAPGAELYCLVSPVDVLPRIKLARVLEANPIEGLSTPVAVAECRWPAAGGALSAAFILPRPEGPRLSGGSAAGLSTAELSRRILSPLVTALSALESASLTHRAIRADNLFWSDPDRTAVILGECFSATAGADQPAVYEPLHRMTAMPTGRGAGAPEDDFYALGVLIIDLVYGLRGSTGYPPALVQRKLEQGSLGALLPQASPAPELAMLLRGLLTDDPSRRWGARQLSRWLAGEQIEMPPPVGLIASQRPLEIGKARFRSARSLAYGIWRHRNRALPLLRDGTIERWLRVSLGDQGLAAGISREIAEAARRPAAPALARDMLLQRCCMMLDPTGPVRFGSVAAMPDALGAVLAGLVLRGSETHDVEVLLRAAAAGKLVGAFPGDRPNAKQELQQIVQLMESSRLGGGMARCVYELHPDLPCQSSSLSEPSSDVRRILSILDRRAAAHPDRTNLLDEDIAAFIASKLALNPSQLGALEKQFGGLWSAIGKELRLLALAQAHFGPDSLPGLARTVAVSLAPVVRQLHGRADRKKVAADVAMCVEKGDLGGILRALDDAALWSRDRGGFARAQREFSACARELERLADPRRSGLTGALAEGRRLAAVVSLSGAIAILSLQLIWPS